MKKFTPGTVVVFEPANFHKDFWDGLSEDKRISCYGDYGYGADKQKLFVYLCPILDTDGTDSGHCVLVSLDDQKIHTMMHAEEFRRALETEF